MLKSLAVVLSGVLVLSGCHFSHVDANATVTISGSALDATGAPLAGAQVRVFTEADIADVVFGSILAIGTLGSICLLPDSPAICQRAHTTTTDADGHFTLQLKGSDTQGLVGTEATLDAVVAAKGSSATSPATTLSFTVKDTTVQLPAARLWNAAPRVAQGGGHLTLTWQSLPAAYGTSASFAAQYFLSGQAVALWTQSASGGRSVADARVLEDVQATAAAGANTSLDGVGTGTVHAHYLSARLPLKGTAGAPQSRHHACSAVMGTATITALAQPTCAATDGNLVQPAQLTGTNGAVVTGAVIDLGKAAPISLVVAHGIAGMTIVEVSTDGLHYREVGILTDSPAAVAPPGNPVARYVRVRAPSGLDESLLYEISVWTD
jgi:hypothetical protein